MLVRAGRFVRAANTSTSFECAGWQFGFGTNASVNRLAQVSTDNAPSSFAPPEPVALGLYTYQTLSADDFTAFDKDFGDGECGPMSLDPSCHNCASFVCSLVRTSILPEPPPVCAHS